MKGKDIVKKENLLTKEEGSAMVETALMMPIYLLIIFSVIFFGNQIILQQESIQAVRYWATDEMNTVATEGSESADFITQTSGDNFLHFATAAGGSIDSYSVNTLNEQTFMASDLEEVLKKESWRADATYDIEGNETLVESMTNAGNLVYNSGMLDDTQLYADELNDYFHRVEAALTLIYAPPYLDAMNSEEEVISPATISAYARGNNRDNTLRELPFSKMGFNHVIEDHISEIESDTPPLTWYPDFLGAYEYWDRN